MRTMTAALIKPLGLRVNVLMIKEIRCLKRVV